MRPFDARTDANNRAALGGFCLVAPRRSS